MRTCGLACFLALVVCCGCGKSEKKFVVTGSVTYQGQAVERGAISFVPEDSNAPSQGAEILDGRYTCEVTPGKKTVRITGSKQAPPQKGDDPGLVLFEDFIPREFNQDSTLTVEITGTATEDFALAP